MGALPVYKGRLTATEAGALSGVSYSTIIHAIHSGKLNADKNGRQYFILASDLEEYWRSSGFRRW